MWILLFLVGEGLDFLQLLLLARTQLRACAVLTWMFILCHPTKNEPRKRTKGSNTLWKPAVRLCGRYAFAPRNTTQKSTSSALAFAS